MSEPVTFSTLTAQLALDMRMSWLDGLWSSIDSDTASDPFGSTMAVSVASTRAMVFLASKTLT